MAKCPHRYLRPVPKPGSADAEACGVLKSMVSRGRAKSKYAASVKSVAEKKKAEQALIKLSSCSLDETDVPALSRALTIFRARNRNRYRPHARRKRKHERYWNATLPFAGLALKRHNRCDTASAGQCRMMQN